MKPCMDKMKDTWVPWVVLGGAFGSLLILL
jgi:hypothetical protein